MDKKLTIEDLLRELESPNIDAAKKKLNDDLAGTWSRIGSEDTFDELGLEPSELDAFLKQWADENPYSNI